MLLLVLRVVGARYCVESIVVHEVMLVVLDVVYMAYGVNVTAFSSHHLTRLSSYIVAFTLFLHRSHAAVLVSKG